ncbi:hypothetical protein BDF21DRAFT_347875 [Thamnidium elegans]|nr:hypothetical protein BDF21DRAFT_347875 [Thamnidium elegans]
MDIDGPEFLSTINSEIATIRTNARTNTSATDIFDSYLATLEAYNEMCVLDTNFLISKLGYLDTVLSLAEENPGNLLIIIPWVVIRELDGLKSVKKRKDGEDVAVRARQAMRFIELRLREKYNSLRGQKMDEIFSQSMTQIVALMVHDIEPISSEYVPKMEALLNRIGGKHHKTLTKKWTVPQQPEPVINTDDYVNFLLLQHVYIYLTLFNCLGNGNR